MEQAIFLTEKQVDELTGISRGCTLHRGTKMERKVMKYDLQVSHLRTTGLAFFINARGRPIVTRAAVEGRKEEAQIEAGWNPRLAYLAQSWDANHPRTCTCRPVCGPDASAATNSTITMKRMA